MKKILIFLLLLLYPMQVLSLDTDLHSENVLLYNINDNRIIYEKNMDSNVKIASLTKIVTIMVSLENIDNLKEEVIIDSSLFKDLKKRNASVAGFQNNEVVTYEDLLYGAMLPSGADAALMLAHNIFGSEEKFVLKMNEFASELKINNTYFTNTSGLNDKKQKSTLNDFLKIMLYALQKEDFKKIFFAKEYKTSNNRLTFKSTLKYFSDKYNLDTNLILGSKTGYTNEAGLCLVSYVENDYGKFLLITTNAPTTNLYPYHVVDAINIYDYFFNNYKNFNLLKNGEIITNVNTKNSNKKKVNIIYKGKDIKMFLPNKNNISYKYDVDELINYNQDVNKSVGNITIYIDNEKHYIGELFIEQKLTFSSKEFIKNNLLIILFLLFISGVIIKKSLRYF